MAKIQMKNVLQYNGQEFDLSAVEANVKKDWKDQGNKLTAIETLDIYVKPDEAKAYYVVNGEITGSVDL